MYRSINMPRPFHYATKSESLQLRRGSLQTHPAQKSQHRHAHRKNHQSTTSTADDLADLSLPARLGQPVPSASRRMRNSTSVGGTVCPRIGGSRSGGRMSGEQSCGRVSRGSTINPHGDHRTENTAQRAPVSKVVARFSAKAPYTIHYPSGTHLSLSTSSITAWPISGRIGCSRREGLGRRCVGRGIPL